MNPGSPSSPYTSGSCLSRAKDTGSFGVELQPHLIIHRHTAVRVIAGAVMRPLPRIDFHPVQKPSDSSLLTHRLLESLTAYMQSQ